MPSSHELAQEYARRLVQSTEKRIEAQKIADSINGLTYSENHSAVSYEDKRIIVNEIYEIIRDSIVFKEFSSQEYLNLVNFIFSQLGGSKK